MKEFIYTLFIITILFRLYNYFFGGPSDEEVRQYEVEELDRLAKLRDSGALTEVEFQAHKRELLGLEGESTEPAVSDLEQVEKLAELKEKGVLSDEEFKLKKKSY